MNHCFLYAFIVCFYLFFTSLISYIDVRRSSSRAVSVRGSSRTKVHNSNNAKCDTPTTMSLSDAMSNCDPQDLSVMLSLQLVRWHSVKDGVSWSH